VREHATREPVAFRVCVAAHGIYYEVDRRTEDVLVGDAHADQAMTFLVTMRLDDAPSRGWTVTAVERSG